MRLPEESAQKPRRRESAGPAWRLRGEVGGVERRFWLGSGETTLGGSEACDLVLDVPGISRRHVRFRVGSAGVEIEDLGSKNGTFLNGKGVERRRLAGGGDVLRVGLLTLTLDAVDPGDAELAVALAPPPSAVPLGPGTTEQSTWRIEKSWLPELFLDRLAALADPGMEAALAALASVAGAAGAGLLRCREGQEPLVVGRVGEPCYPDGCAELAQLVESIRAAPAAACGSGFVASSSLSCAVWGEPDREPLVVLLLGGMVPAAERERLLRLAVRLFAWRLAADPFTPGVLRSPAAELPQLVFPEGYVVGSSPAMAELFQSMRELCRSSLSLLIQGETGAGKEHIARILHASSPRARGPFVSVNCAAIPRDLLEAEMFGVAEGTATGVRGRPGRLQQAQGGSLFLDEIGEMPPELQVKLLRALEEREIRPLGGRPQAVDVRFLAATNQDLTRAVKEGRFRQDLYFRLAGAELAVPALRERRADILALVVRFLTNAATAIGKPIRGLSVNALDLLERYPWPGNVRELAHEVERLVHACPPDQAIESNLLAERIRAAEPEEHMAAGTSLRLEHNIEKLEAWLIPRALEEAGGSQRRAAALLGISRNALARKLRRLGLHPEGPS